MPNVDSAKGLLKATNHVCILFNTDGDFRGDGRWLMLMVRQLGMVCPLDGVAGVSDFSEVVAWGTKELCQSGLSNLKSFLAEQKEYQNISVDFYRFKILKLT